MIFNALFLKYKVYGIVNDWFYYWYFLAEININIIN